MNNSTRQIISDLAKSTFIHSKLTYCSKTLVSYENINGIHQECYLETELDDHGSFANKPVYLYTCDHILLGVFKNEDRATAALAAIKQLGYILPEVPVDISELDKINYICQCFSEPELDREKIFKIYIDCLINSFKTFLNENSREAEALRYAQKKLVRIDKNNLIKILDQVHGVTDYEQELLCQYCQTDLSFLAAGVMVAEAHDLSSKIKQGIELTQVPIDAETN